MLVEKAGWHDVAGVMGIVTHCICDMRSKGIYQWDEVYPNSAVFEEDTREGSLYVIRQTGACVAAICLNEEQPEEYGRLPWRYRSGRALVIHRLCVHPEWQGQGLAAHLLAFAGEYAVERGYATIRFDAYSGNPRALGLYERQGYERVAGTVCFPRRELPFYCYEKGINAKIVG